MTVSERSERSSQDDAIRYPSLDSLRAAHTELIKRFRASGRTPEMIAEVEKFIRRGAATGALLDTDAERWAAQSQLDYWATQLYQPGYEPPDATLDEFDPELAPELDDSLCPYMGLDSFREANELVFFGRRRLIAELVNELKNSRFLAVLGSSGSGKSSVVRAGLIPELKRSALPGSEEWIYFPPMVPGSHPLVNLARLMLAEADADQAEKESDLYRDNGGYLTRVVKERFKNDVVLVIDQFEEIFTLCTDDAARQCFVENLIALCKASNARHRVIITMRSDFEMNIARLPALQDLFEKHVVRVTPLTAAELREAIEAPAARIGLKFEEGVVDALLSDTLGEPAALPLLQFTLLKLWERREHNRVTWESYKKLGGGRQALALSADQVYMRLIPEQRVTMRRILLKMVRPGEGLEVTSNRVPRVSLYHKAEANDRIDRVLERLIKERLVRVSEGDMAGDEQVEIAHEALVRNWPRLVEWLEEERVTLRQRQRLTAAAEEWQRLDRDTSALWRGVLLEEVKRYDDLNDLEKEFVAAGSDAELTERKKLEKSAAKMRKRAYYLTTALAVALVAVFAAIRFGLEANKFGVAAQNSAEEASIQAAIADEVGISAMYGQATAVANKKEAERQAELTLASRLASQAQLITETQSSKQTVGLLLAIQSMRINPSGEAAQILQNSLQKNLLGTPLSIINRNGPVYAVAFSPDGKYVASASFENTIVLTEVDGGEEGIVLPQEAWVTAIAFSPDGEFVVTATENDIILVRELLSGEEIARFDHEAPVYRVAISPNGSYVASISEDGHPRFWEVATGREITLLGYKDARVYNVAFSADGTRVVTGGDDRTSRVWLLPRGEEIAYQTLESPISAVALSPDGKYVVASSDDGTVLLWDVASGKEISSVKYDAPVFALAFSVDGTYIISGGVDRTARVREAATGFEISRLDFDGIVNFVAFSADGSSALAGGDDGTVRVWDVASGEELIRLPHESWVHAAAFSPDGEYIVSGSDDGNVRIWRTRSQSELAGVTHGAWVTSVDFSSDGKYVVSGSADGSARVWDAATGEEIATLIHEGGVYRVAFSPDGKYVLTGNFDNTVRVWEVATGEVVTQMTHDGAVYSVAWSPNGKYVLSGSDDTTARVWSVATGEEIKHITYDGFVLSVAFSHDGKYALSGGCMKWVDEDRSSCFSGIAHVWEPLTGRKVSEKNYESNVYAVAFSPDGKYAASGSEDGTVLLWDITGGKDIFRGSHQAPVFALAFSPDGKWLVSGGDDGVVTVWEVATGDLISSLTYDGPVRSVTFSPNGLLVAAGSTDHTARVSDAETGDEIGRMRHNDWVNSVAFSPDGRYVVSGSDDGTARIWIWDPEELIKRVCSRLPQNLSREEWTAYLGERPYERACPNLPIPPELGTGQ